MRRPVLLIKARRLLRNPPYLEIRYLFMWRRALPCTARGPGCEAVSSSPANGVACRHLRLRRAILRSSLSLRVVMLSCARITAFRFQPLCSQAPSTRRVASGSILWCLLSFSTRVAGGTWPGAARYLNAGRSASSDLPEGELEGDSIWLEGDRPSALLLPSYHPQASSRQIDPADSCAA